MNAALFVMNAVLLVITTALLIMNATLLVMNFFITCNEYCIACNEFCIIILLSNGLFYCVACHKFSTIFYLYSTVNIYNQLLIQSICFFTVILLRWSLIVAITVNMWIPIMLLEKCEFFILLFILKCTSSCGLVAVNSETLVLYDVCRHVCRYDYYVCMCWCGWIVKK